MKLDTRMKGYLGKKMEQKFTHGDHVMIAKDLGDTMRHFDAGCEAIVIASYADKFGFGSNQKYSIFLRDRGEVSWYYENQLTLISKGAFDILSDWKAEIKAFKAEKSDMDWIFANGQEVVEKMHGPSIAALAKCFGIDDLWGRGGEGVTLIGNSIATLQFAYPFLQSGDKDGYLLACESVKASRP